MTPLATLFLGPDEARQASRKVLAETGTIRVSGEAVGLAEGIALALATQPDLVVLSFAGDLPGTLGTVDQLQGVCPSTQIMLVGASLGADELSRAMQAGVREVVADPATLPEAVQRAQVFVGRLRGARTPAVDPRPQAGKVLVVYSPKGGSGKSTLAANLAVALTQADAPGEVALVDLSAQFGEIDLLFNLKPRAFLADLAKLSHAPDLESVEQALVAHDSGVQVLASAPTPEEGELVTASLVEGVLGALRRRAALTVVDAPAHLSEPLMRALELADRIVVPFFPDLASLRHVQTTVKLWQDLGLDVQKVELVGWARKSDVDAEAIARVLRRPLAVTLPYVPEEALAAVNAGTPMVLSAPKGAFAKAIAAYAARFVERPTVALVAAHAASNPLRTLWSRIRRLIDVPAQPT